MQTHTQKKREQIERRVLLYCYYNFLFLRKGADPTFKWRLICPATIAKVILCSLRRLSTSYLKDKKKVKTHFNFSFNYNRAEGVLLM